MSQEQSPATLGATPRFTALANKATKYPLQFSQAEVWDALAITERELAQAKADLAEVDEANTRLARSRQTTLSETPQIDDLEQMTRTAFANDQEWIDNEMWKDDDMRAFCARLVQLARTIPSATPQKRAEYHPNLDGPAEPVGRSLCIFREGCRLDACAGEQRCCGRDVP